MNDDERNSGRLRSRPRCSKPTENRLQANAGYFTVNLTVTVLVDFCAFPSTKAGS
jgi:hypothetical protein